MDTVTQLHHQHADLFASMYREGIFNSQFVDVHQIEHHENLESLRELVDLFYEDLEKRLNEVAVRILEREVDFRRLHEIVQGFRETCLSFGTRRLINSCDAFIACYNASNFERCVGCLQHLKDEYDLFKIRMKTLLQLEHDILAAGGPLPVIDCPHLKMKKMFNPGCHRVYAE